MHYEYKFEKIKLGWPKLFTKPNLDYHEIIAKHAKDGWRLVQIFAPGTSVYGSASYFELIFERPVN